MEITPDGEAVNQKQHRRANTAKVYSPSLHSRTVRGFQLVIGDACNI